MKKIALIIVMLVFVAQSYGQQNKEERIKTIKIGFITEQLDLSSSEAEKFWPIYNKHQDVIYQLRKKERNQIRKEINQQTDINSISNAKANELLDAILSIDQKIQKEEIAMYTELRKVIAPQKLLKLRKAEKDFNRKMLEQYKRRQGHHPR